MNKRVLRCIVAAMLPAFGCNEARQPLLPDLQASRNPADYEVVDLGTFGGSQAQAFVINEAGTVLGRYGAPNARQRSFSWTRQTGMQDLGDVDGMPFNVVRTNNRGEMTGFIPVNGDVNAPIRAVRRNRDGTFTYLDDPAYDGQAWGINEAGDIAGHRSINHGPFQAFIWTRQHGLHVIAPYPSPALRPGSRATGINNLGQVVGSTTYKDPARTFIEERAFIWDETNDMRILPSLGGVQSIATMINTNGVVVGASQTRVPHQGERPLGVLSFSPLSPVPGHGWRWSEARGIEDLGTLGGQHSVAWGVDPFGNAYGWAENAIGEQRAVKWPWSGGIETLGGLGGTTSQADAANARGVAPGQAADANGVLHAVIYFPR